MKKNPEKRRSKAKRSVPIHSSPQFPVRIFVNQIQQTTYQCVPLALYINITTTIITNLNYKETNKHKQVWMHNLKARFLSTQTTK